MTRYGAGLEVSEPYTIPSALSASSFSAVPALSHQGL